MPKTIATVDEYDAATQRISELENFAEGTPQADELGRARRCRHGMGQKPTTTPRYGRMSA
jgi:hypothetical protein